MPLFAGVYETNITPPPGVWMSGYALRPSGAVGVHDELYARALVLEDGHQRLVLVVADLIALPYAMSQQIRGKIAEALGIEAKAVMLHCTHTHGGPYLGTFRTMGEADPAYSDVLARKLIGVATQAASRLVPAHLTYGETSAQIGVNRRRSGADGRISGHVDYGGVVVPTVQTLCIDGADGRLIALLCCHACHPTTMERDNLQFTGDWPGAAVAHLQARFRKEGEEKGIAEGALPFCLVGCCGDINPVRRGTWEAVAENGRQVAEAAHTARWAAHGRLEGGLRAEEVSLELPLLPPPEDAALHSLERDWETKLQRAGDEGQVGQVLMAEGHLAWVRECLRLNAERSYAVAQSFSIQHFSLEGVSLLGFPAEIFAQYALDFSRQTRQPVIALGYTNGCWNYVPTAAEYARGGYEVAEAYKYYGTQMFAPDCEPRIRQAVYPLLGIDDPDTSPYELLAGRPRG